MTSYTQLTYEQRCHIQVLNKTGLSQAAMANAVGVNQSTISREIQRNTGARGYRLKQAHAKGKAVMRTVSNTLACFASWRGPEHAATDHQNLLGAYAVTTF